jgi:hypothetical protein
MSKKVILSADSCCDLDEELKQRYEVHYIHPTILLEGKSYTDCVDIFPDDLYQALPFSTIPGIFARVSTLLTRVGIPHKPFSAGNGGFIRG